MESQSKEIEELSTRSIEKSFEQLLDEEEEEEDTYMINQQKIDPNTIRMREAKTMKDALMSLLNALKTRGLLNSTYSMEELNHFFSTSESKVLRHLLMEDFMTRNTFFEWLHDLKEYVTWRHLSMRRTSIVRILHRQENRHRLEVWTRFLLQPVMRIPGRLHTRSAPPFGGLAQPVATQA
ncbi:hypothetical protein G5I_13232 [Acromyrmex echinatior]|uniref:Uncharacterized protein n=1 Tax=Acromyrmex echinatior TaxID=103372 RepID=F4X4H1_ACREC|nr:hypothetical protein G5I_13232 [Acromyrmex echinatior]